MHEKYFLLQTINVKISHDTKVRIAVLALSVALVLWLISTFVSRNTMHVLKKCFACLHIACESETWNPLNLRWFYIKNDKSGDVITEKVYCEITTYVPWRSVQRNVTKTPHHRTFYPLYIICWLILRNEQSQLDAKSKLEQVKPYWQHRNSVPIYKAGIIA